LLHFSSDIWPHFIVLHMTSDFAAMALRAVIMPANIFRRHTCGSGGEDIGRQ
jgi:hypothetical protein